MKKLIGVCILLLLLSSPVWSQPLLSFSAPDGYLLVSQTEWNGFKLSYAQLLKASATLDSNLQKSADYSSQQTIQLALVWLDLNTARNLIALSGTQLQTARAQIVLLQGQVTKSVISLNELNATISKELRLATIKGIALGVGGTVVTGLLIWAGVELTRYIKNKNE